MRIDPEELSVLAFLVDEITPCYAITYKEFVAFDENEYKVTAKEIESTNKGPREIEYSFCFNPKYNEHTLETLRNWQQKKGK